ncbi:UNVERIFIED_CONTAM: hypothetical protein FKN15_047869 [Acipenser sinensis]
MQHIPRYKIITAPGSQHRVQACSSDSARTGVLKVKRRACSVQAIFQALRERFKPGPELS